jgi:tetratricopeptide (TPR) repeat protein
VEDVFKRTRMDVLRGSNSKQAPWYSSTLEEEFISPRLPGDPRRRRREPTPRRPRPSLRFRPPAPTKAGIDARRQNRNPGAPATAPKPVTPANPDAARDESIRQLDARIRANPNDVAAIYTRGQIYAKNRNFSRAIKDFDEVVRLDPKCRGAQQSLLGAAPSPAIFQAH